MNHIKSVVKTLLLGNYGRSGCCDNCGHLIYEDMNYANSPLNGNSLTQTQTIIRVQNDNGRIKADSRVHGIKNTV